MPVQPITAAQFAQSIKTSILSRNQTYDVNIGPIPDLIINPVSTVMETQNNSILALQDLLSLNNSGSFTYQDLVSFVANEGVVPSNGSKATTSLTFSTSKVPYSLTVSSGYPVASIVDETTNTSVTFITIADATLDYTTRASYFNPVTQKYELSVACVATTAGSVGNVGAGRIIRPLRPLVGFESVSNPSAASGGLDASSIDELIEQYLIAITGSSVAVADGTRRVAIDLFSNVLDTAVVYGNDPLLVRASTDAGAVDLWVMGSMIVSQTDVVTYMGPLVPIPLLNQPVAQVTSVTSGANTLVQGVDYNFVPDTGGYSGSTSGQDSIVFLNTSSLLPASGSPVTVIYNQNTLMQSMQSLYAQPQYNVFGRNILVRAAQAVALQISATFKVKSGYNVTTIQTSIQNQIVSFINSMLLNARIPGSTPDGYVNMSDVNAQVRRISGVDNFTITAFSVLGGTGAADVPIGANQYPTISSTNITLTLGT